ncbi:MAG TPA: DUF485 domain-containing protein [Streptosporangiaceae bacterium]|nr:DUF485 domain-containing protein [Streptosporangiaceae bacterium]
MSVTQSGRGNVSGYEVVHASREFRTLRRHLGSFAGPAIALFLGWYFLYVIVAAFAPGFMRIRVEGEVNVGLCFGVLQFVSTFVITIVYRRWAQQRFDPQSERLRQRLDARRKP